MRLTRRQAITAGLGSLAALAGCQSTVNRKYRYYFDFATQHRDFNVEIETTPKVASGHYLEGEVAVTNTGNETADAELLLEVRQVDGDGYRSLADKVKLDPGETKTVPWNVSHRGPGRYEISVSGFANDTTVLVHNTSSTRYKPISIGNVTMENETTTSGGDE